MFVLLPFLILIVAMMAFIPLMLRFAVCLRRSLPWRAYLCPCVGAFVTWSAMIASYFLADRSGVDLVTIHAAPVFIGVVPFAILGLAGVNWLQHLTSGGS